ncbi:MAG: class I SAM-dependent methyltransferase [Armatimonadetes bacterium]|nr:class I SAM-dependent methyltransferase [Armatimonadota bacterium]
MDKHALGGRPVWPAVPDCPADLFVGTAEYYAKYRLPYPQELIDDLRMRAEITGNGRLLDLGCGTGEVALAMHTFFSEVWAVDQEPEMIEVGRRKAEQCGAANVVWMIGRAEDVEVPPNSFEMITMGSSFHRFDRRLIAERAWQWLPSGHCMVAMGNNVAWNGKREWQRITAGIISRWLDNPEDGSEPVRHIWHEEVLEDVGFQVEVHRFPTPYVWTIDAFIGFVYSTSRASKRALGDRCDEFEADMRNALLGYDPSGLYPETVDFYYVLARRPKA